MDALRQLPSVHQLLTHPVVVRSSTSLPHSLVASVIRTELDTVRHRIQAGSAAYCEGELLAQIQNSLASYTAQFLQPVVNATGVMIHTNLGRVPLPSDTLETVKNVASGYSNLEYDLADGVRGSRYQAIRHLLQTITGAEDSLVVNNNAAAVLLVLAALAKGREVLVSRGELVEIGGGFRVPDVITESGCILKEVGTTNKTRAADYADAISENTAAILKVHPSNYQIMGFTETPKRQELQQLCRQHKLWFVEDLGSGALWDTHINSVQQEPMVQDVVGSVDVVTFSGDKLLGGPQAGIIAGGQRALEPIKKHPLLRAVRIDKLSLIALQDVLLKYASNDLSSFPLVQMLSTPIDTIKERALQWQASLGHGWQGRLLQQTSTIGGGSLPGQTLATWVLALTSTYGSTSDCEQRLRRCAPPILGRIQAGELLLDPRTVFPNQDPLVTAALQKGWNAECTS